MQQYPGHLAWHETMELHELVAFTANHVIGLKNALPKIQDENLRSLYREAIHGSERHLQELLQFYPEAPVFEQRKETDEMLGYFAGSLLIFAKTSVRNYAIAITETATPQFREVLQKQLLESIKLHGKVFHYMYANGFYPAYNLEQLLANDLKNAKKALSL